jgi:predicted metalloprotease
MKWTRGHQSADVEDRRGVRARGGGSALKLGGGGALLTILVVVASQVLGVDLTQFVGGSGGGGAPAPSSDPQGGALDPATDPDRELYEFISFAFDDIQVAFGDALQRKGETYRKAKLVIFADAVDTGCGTASSAVGPFYCPPDQKAYIDLGFYRDLKKRFGAPGDFAQAYVIAHELGHHLQTLSGVSARVERQGRSNELSVRQELQADCYAGVWAKTTEQRRILEAGDVEEALGAAAAIGDDRLQKQAGAPVSSETWTHGSSEQRVRWFKRGMESGDLAACDTFSAKDL